MKEAFNSSIKARLKILLVHTFETLFKTLSHYNSILFGIRAIVAQNAIPSIVIFETVRCKWNLGRMIIFSSFLVPRERHTKD